MVDVTKTEMYFINKVIIAKMKLQEIEMLYLFYQKARGVNFQMRDYLKQEIEMLKEEIQYNLNECGIDKYAGDIENFIDNFKNWRAQK